MIYGKPSAFHQSIRFLSMKTFHTGISLCQAFLMKRFLGTFDTFCLAPALAKDEIKLVIFIHV